MSGYASERRYRDRITGQWRKRTVFISTHAAPAARKARNRRRSKMARASRKANR